MVPRAGFEPATLGLEVLCSIQLSYRGTPVVQGVRNLVYTIAVPQKIKTRKCYSLPYC